SIRQLQFTKKTFFCSHHVNHLTAESGLKLPEQLDAKWLVQIVDDLGLYPSGLKQRQSLTRLGTSGVMEEL
ncbi:MAG: hypothetical protein EBZ14_09590, partial [Gammaproteobacteria bacterium]|nr:hypothetical protein [Gammaproteobacteria bacterium]